MLQAIQVLSYRISAIGTDHELIRIYTEVKAFESPFLMQNVELHRYLTVYIDEYNGTIAHSESVDHLLVMLDQCDATVTQIRKLMLRVATSIVDL